LNYYYSEDYNLIEIKHLHKVKEFINSLPKISKKSVNESLDENSIFLEDIKKIKSKLSN